jgi:hypothetical protein
MKKQKFKFESAFANIKIRPVVSEEKDKYLSVASLDKLRKFLPEINTEDNVDLLPVAFDACVVNRVNKNGDVIDGETAAKIAKLFVNKPINIEHNRSQVIGCILSSNFSKFGTNESLAEVDVKSMKTPFNITLGGVIWKIVDRDLADQIEESNDPTSDNYMTISASWELGFNDYNIVVLDGPEKNIENGTIISDASQIDKLKNHLRGFGGSGKLGDDKFIYRQVLGKVVPLGIGFTLNPAADVQGIATPPEQPIKIELKVNKSSEEAEVQEEKAAELAQEPVLASENTVSQEEKLDVKKERIYMKITKIEDITDSLLKEATASSIVEFVAEEIKKANETFLAEKSAKENELKAANEKISAVEAEHEAVKKQVVELTEKLATIEAEKEAKAKEESFNLRMASLDEEFDLSDEDRKVIASDIKDLNEETFSAYKNKMSVLMKEKNKAYKKAMAEKMQKEKEMAEKAMQASEVKASEAPAAETTQEVVEQAVDNGAKASTEIPNSAPAAQPSVKEKYAAAFGFDGFELIN